MHKVPVHTVKIVSDYQNSEKSRNLGAISTTETNDLFRMIIVLFR